MRNVEICNGIKLVGDLKPQGESIFTTSGAFTVPKGVKQLQVFCVGGGGNGGGFVYSFSGVSTNGGGGGGGYTKTGYIDTYYGDTINVSVGSSSSLTSVGIVASNGGNNGGVENGGNGGSGGGGGNSHASFDVYNGGEGGSDGNNGGNSSKTCHSTIYTGGAGQLATTRAFGETNGTLYAGGGGGGGCTYFDRPSDCAKGGDGGGGNGAWRYCRGESHYGHQNSATDGSLNTGGGGGGCGFNEYEHNKVTYGGSGIAIIRWGY